VEQLSLEALLTGENVKSSKALRNFSELRLEAIEQLRLRGIVRDPNIMRAMNRVPREEFLPDNMKSSAYLDSPLPIGLCQTTSALHMTALFCEYGEMKLGQRIFEVGGGCGYMSCVYAEVVAPPEQPRQTWGHVWSAELLSKLAELGRRNVERLGYADRVTFLQADASEGLEEEGTFDLIIVTSAAPKIPTKLVAQVKAGGILLIPVGGAELCQELIRVRKEPDGTLSEENLGEVAFVLMKGKSGWKF
jgi:protein-L-isoaspartate(D-aspartate) O-methyltransferase